MKSSILPAVHWPIAKTAELEKANSISVKDPAPLKNKALLSEREMKNIPPDQFSNGSLKTG